MLEVTMPLLADESLYSKHPGAIALGIVFSDRLGNTQLSHQRGSSSGNHGAEDFAGA
jgi:hypothetical protein